MREGGRMCVEWIAALIYISFNAKQMILSHIKIIKDSYLPLLFHSMAYSIIKRCVAIFDKLGQV